MSLLRIHGEALEHPITSGEGMYKDPCVSCALNDICVGGCCSNHSRCVQTTCHQECNDCGGGDLLRFEGGNVPAVCSKAPLRELQLEQVRRESYDFTPRDLIKHDTKSAVITQGSFGQTDGSFYPEGTEIVGVNIRHVWSSRGWFSSDMKDYLKLPPGAKLLLLTATKDDVLERAWEFGVQHADFEAIGFDYWQALEFSTYGYMSRYHNLWTAYRLMESIELSRAHFGQLIPVEVDRAKRDKLGLFRVCAENIPQAVINCQFLSVKRLDTFRRTLAAWKRALKGLPLKALWFLGVVSPEMVYNIRMNFSAYDCYFLAVNPWLAAFKGDAFLRSGKLKKSRLPRRELVLQNQCNYANLVRHALDAASSELSKRGENDG